MRVSGWLRSAAVHRRLTILAVLVGCFVWAMVVVGLSFAMAERGNDQWWVIPLFGAFVLSVAVLAARWVPAAPTAHPGTAATSGPPSVAVQRRLAEALSPRELEVLHHLAAGRTNAEIAKALFVAPGTVKAHLNHIFRKLEATSRLQAVAHAREAGLLE